MSKWRGVGVWLVVAGLLLPATPVWSQPGAPPGGGGGGQDPAAALKELREKLAELEKKLARPVEPQPKVDAEALKKAEVELKVAQAALEQKLAEVKLLQAKVAEAHARLQKVGGQGEGRIILKLEGGDGVLRLLTEGKDKTRVIEVPVLPGQPVVPPIKIGEGGGWRVIPAVPPPAAPEKRIDNLEQKLDRLIQELQDLRKSLPRPGAPGGGRPGAGAPVGEGGLRFAFEAVPGSGGKDVLFLAKPTAGAEKGDFLYFAKPADGEKKDVFFFAKPVPPTPGR
jgi:hypothetical protein